MARKNKWREKINGAKKKKWREKNGAKKMRKKKNGAKKGREARRKSATIRLFHFQEDDCFCLGHLPSEELMTNSVYAKNKKLSELFSILNTGQIL